MISVSRAVDFHAPPEKVWTHIEDPTKELQWRQPEVTRLEIIGDGPGNVGTR